MKEPGDINPNGQRLVRKTKHRGNHPTSLIWVLECTHCGGQYGANGFDAHERRCPEAGCQHGAPGLKIPT